MHLKEKGLSRQSAQEESRKESGERAAREIEGALSADRDQARETDRTQVADLDEAANEKERKENDCLFGQPAEQKGAFEARHSEIAGRGLTAGQALEDGRTENTPGTDSFLPPSSPEKLVGVPVAQER